MANEEVLGPRKTMLVLVIVVGCFAVLWPRLLSPLLLGRDHLKPNQFDRDAGCCEVIFETEVSVLELLSEVCSSAIGPDGKLSLYAAAECRRSVNSTCGVDIAQFLKRDNNVRKTAKAFMEMLQSSNSSCLQEHFGVPVWSLSKHTVLNSWMQLSDLKQERPMTRGAGPHPALRERGRAIPPASGVPTPPSRGPVPLPPHARVRSPLYVYYEVEVQPPPIPGMRPPLGAPGGPVPAPKSSMSFVMPIYTICIIVFFVYTLSKILFKRTGSPYEVMTPDPQFRRRVFRDDSRSSPETKLVVTAISGLVSEVQQQMEGSRPANQQRAQDVQDELGRPYTNGSVLLNNASVRIVTSEYKEDSPDNVQILKESTPEPIQKPEESSPKSISEPKDETPESKELSLEPVLFTSNDIIPKLKDAITESNEKCSELIDAMSESNEFNSEAVEPTSESESESIIKPKEPTPELEEKSLVQKEPTIELKERTSEPRELIQDSKDLVQEPKDTVAEPKDTIPEPTNTIPEPKENTIEPIEPTLDQKELISELIELLPESKELGPRLNETEFKGKTPDLKDVTTNIENSTQELYESEKPEEEIPDSKEKSLEPKELVIASDERPKESIVEAGDSQVSLSDVENEEPKKILDESLQRLKSSFGEELQKLTSELSELTEETKKANDLIEASLGFISNEKEQFKVVSTEELEEKAREISPEKKQSTPELLAEALKESPEKEEVSEEEYTEEEVEEEEEEEREPEKSTLKVLGMTVSAHSVDGSAWPETQPPVQPRPPPHRQEPKEVTEIYLEGEIPQQARVLVADFDGTSDKNKDRHSPLVVSGKMTLSLIQDSPRDTPERELESTVDDFTTASAVTQPAAEKKETSDDEIEEEVVLEESEEEVEVEEIEEEEVEEEEEEETKPQNKEIPKTK